MKDLVSIIMTTCNRKEFSQRAIEAVLKNTQYQPYQFILVDNGSLDGTREIIEEMASLYPEILFLFSSKNLGRGRGANYGLRLAEGEYLIILDDDLIVPLGWMEKMTTALKAVPQVGWLSTNLKGEENDPEEILESDPRYMKQYDGIRIETPPGVGGWCMAMPRSVYERLGGLQEDRFYGGIDKEYYQQAISEGLLVGYVQDVVAHHYGGTKKEMQLYPQYREYKIQVHHQRWFQGKNTLAQKDFFAQQEEEKEENQKRFKGARIPEEIFIKDRENSHFYYYEKGKKSLPPSLPEELEELITSKARDCPHYIVKEIPLEKPQPVKLLRTREENTVYLILGRKRHPISSLENFHRYNFQAEQIEVVQEAILLAYEKGEEI